MRNPLLLGILYMLVEIALLIVVGKAIGVLPTLLLIVATSALGVVILKKNGTKSVQQIKQAVADGQPPGVAMIDAFLAFLGSICLIVPGFAANVLGLLLMFSFTRKLFKPTIFYWLRKKMKGSQIVVYEQHR